MTVECVHVAVAVIIRDGRVLISKRAEHVHQGGLWEFPGGKIEAGESVEAALCREIQEELGINIKNSRPLITLSHHYPDSDSGKQVLLETRVITEFDGRDYDWCEKTGDSEQSGMEGQAVRWVEFKQLDNYQFPAANKPILNAIRLPESYLISPDCVCDVQDHDSQNHGCETVERFLQQFSLSSRDNPLLQLRIKSLSGEMLNDVVKRACDIARKNRSTVLLNSALFHSQKGLDDGVNYYTGGIHLTSHHLHQAKFVDKYRRQFPEKIIAASCHNKEDIERANQLQLDFIVVSPVQHTASHPQQAPLGWDGFKTLTDLAGIPVFALGGMSQADSVHAQKMGAQGIAAIRSLWNKE